MSLATERSKIAPEEVESELVLVEKKLLTLNELLDLFAEKSDSVTMEGVCNLISREIHDCRSSLLDIREWTEMLSQTSKLRKSREGADR